ncbi:MAG TPA: PAS domain-containing sensor histidine kinase, partial [bacterium]|nr:PAS domain-containing sensor histidine kinase [bacterium]
IRDAQGAVYCFQGTVRDITAQKQAQLDRRESEQRYHILIEQLSDAVFQGDADGGFMVVNEAAVALTGRTREQLLQCNMRDLFPPAELGRRPLRHDLLKLGQSYTTERQLLRGDGTTLTVEMTSKMLPDGNHLCVMRDITERSRLLRELQSSNERYQTLFTVETDAIVLVDVETLKIVEANPAACILYGYDHAAMLTLTATDLSDEPVETSGAIGAGGDGIVIIPQRWHRSRSGVRFPVEISARFFTMHGRPMLFCAMRDIGDRMRKQEEREQLLTALTIANSELRSLDELKNNLLSNVSHELRTPLVAVRGYAELMREGISGPVNEQQQAHFDTMLRNIDRLLKLINNLLEFSRQGKHAPLQRERFAVAELIAEVLRLLEPKAAEKQVRLSAEPLPRDVQVLADRHKLQQVLINLTDNALKFTPSGGSVVLAVAADDTRLRLSVTDTGVGIPENERRRIFERFYQIDSSSTRVHGGAGIGLAIVRDIVEQHGGTIEVVSTVGSGSTFTVTLPLT